MKEKSQQLVLVKKSDSCDHLHIEKTLVHKYCHHGSKSELYVEG